MKNRSAKDLAFEKERAKYRKQIRNLETELIKEKSESRKLVNQLTELTDQYRTLQDWVDRLLEYTGLSDEDMKKIIQKDLDQAETTSKVKTMLELLNFKSLVY